MNWDLHCFEQYKEAIEKRGGKYALRLNKESWTHLIIYSERIDYVSTLPLMCSICYFACLTLLTS